MSVMYDYTGRTLSQRYELQRRIGVGGFATVYVAHDLRIYKRKVAVKVLDPERELKSSNVDRFLQEVKVAAKLDGPYRDRVVKIIDQGRCDVAEPTLLYLVMEYVNGITLQQLLRPNGDDQPRQPLPWPQAVALIRELLRALGTLHDAGVVHRDIKPGNCILEQRPDGDFLKLLDLGIVKVMPGYEMSGTSPATQPEFVLGTPRYMAPEQFVGPCSDPRVDLYAAGVMLYEFLTGDVPARWGDLRRPDDPPGAPRPSLANPSAAIPAKLDAVAQRAVALDADARFPTAPAFLAALDEVMSSVAMPAVTTGPHLARPTPPEDPAPEDSLVDATIVEPHAWFGSFLQWTTVVASTLASLTIVYALLPVLMTDARPRTEVEGDDLALPWLATPPTKQVAETPEVAAEVAAGLPVTAATAEAPAEPTAPAAEVGAEVAAEPAIAPPSEPANDSAEASPPPPAATLKTSPPQPKSQPKSQPKPARRPKLEPLLPVQ